MWFVFVGVGLTLVIAAGIYTRRRLATSMTELGVRPRWVRVMRWASAWLLFGYPVIVIVTIAISLGLGAETLPRFEGKLLSWLLGVPFIWAVLVLVQSLPWLFVAEVAGLVLGERGKRVRAIAIVGVVTLFALYTPIRIAIEHGDVRVRHHVVGSGSGLPFRIAFVADVQQDVHTDEDVVAPVIATINRSASDVVISGGDWINSGPDHIADAARTAGALKSRLGTFSVRGDHEHFAYIDRERSVREVDQALAANGVQLIDNQVRWFTHEGKRIGVLFLNYNYIVRTKLDMVASLVATLEPADYSIVVTHQLDRPLAALLEGKVDLVLGAHTHGGQINPVVGVLHVPLARLETTFVDGRYQLGTTDVIVTAGIGMSLVPIRYASPGSLELIELRL
ncbi:MAG: metallophosphoesterase [Kofleriaceae bacterium]